jgi:hypothetical protein
MDPAEGRLTAFGGPLVVFHVKQRIAGARANTRHEYPD